MLELSAIEEFGSNPMLKCGLRFDVTESDITEGSVAEYVGSIDESGLNLGLIWLGGDAPGGRLLIARIVAFESDGLAWLTYECRNAGVTLLLSSSISTPFEEK
jgi:hypothetical protein